MNRETDRLTDGWTNMYKRHTERRSLKKRQTKIKEVKEVYHRICSFAGSLQGDRDIQIPSTQSGAKWARQEAVDREKDREIDRWIADTRIDRKLGERKRTRIYFGCEMWRT